MPGEEEKGAQAQPATVIVTEDASGKAQGQQEQQAGAEEKRFTQAELEAQIKERLERERKKVREEGEKAAAEAEKAKLKEQGQLRELSDKQAAELLALTAEKETLAGAAATLEAKVKAYEEAFGKQLAEAKKGLPEPVRVLLEKMPLLEQAGWMAENGAKLGVAMKGVPATPKADAGNGNSKDDEAAREAATRRYSNF